MASWEDLDAPVKQGNSWESLDAPLGAARPAPGRQAQDFSDAFIAGLQASSGGLAKRGKMPDMELGPDAPWYHRLSSGAGQMIGDVPAMIGGGLAAQVLTGGKGGPIASAAGAFAAPMALREALVEAYTHNYATSWEGVQQVGFAALKGGVKGAVIGAATMGAGQIVKPIAGAVGAFGAELGTLTTTSAALEGHLPTWQEFMDNAILLGGAKGSMHVARGMYHIFAETGVRPEKVLADAKADPKLAAELTETVYRGEVGNSSGEVVWFTPDKAEAKKYGERAAFSAADVKLPEDVYSLDEVNIKMMREWAKEENVDLNNYKLVTAKLDMKKPLDLRDLGTDIGDVETTWNFFHKKGLLSESWKSLDEFAREEVLGEYEGKALWHFIENERVVEAAKKTGYDGIVLSDLGTDAKPHLTYGVFNEQQIVRGVPNSYAPLALEQRIEAAISKDSRPEQIRQNLKQGDEPRPLEVDPNDPVKYEYIADGETAKGVLREVTALYQAEINAQTRGVVPNKTTAAEGLRMATDGAVAPHVIGEAANPAEIYARAHLLRGATADAVTQLQKLAGVPEIELTPAAKLSALAALERVAMLKAEIEGVGAEAGRALQIFRAVKRDPGFLGEAEGLLKLAERKGNLQDIAAMVAKLKDPAQIAEFARQYSKASTMEQVIEGWRAAILSGPQTHLANIMGNLTKLFVEIPESVVSASLLALDKAAHGDPLTLSQWKARAFAPYYGIKLGSVEAIKAATEVWNMKGAHVEKADQFREAIPGRAGEIIRLPFKALQVEDVLFRTLAERAEAYKLAIDRTVKEGLHPETAEGRERVTLYTARPEFGLEPKAAGEIIKQIQDIGAESVFAQRLGPRMEIAQRALQGSPVSFIIPFVRTPANLVSWALQHTPGLNLLSARWRADFSAGGEAQAKAVARVLIGTGLAATAYTLASDGTITGGGMFDKEERRTKVAAGWQPYSVKIGDKYYSFQRIEPVAKVLGIAADLIELERNTKDTDDKAKIATMLVLMFGNATVSTTYLSGLSNAIQAITDPGRYGENFLEQYATSLVPKAIGQTAAAIDPHRREVNGVFDAIQSQIPFLREKLLPKRDVWGEPQKNDRWFAVMPVAVSEASQDKVRTEASRLMIAIADAPRFAQEKGPFNAKDKRVALQEEQRDIFREVSGKNAMAIMGPIVNAQDWDQIPDFAKAEIYKHVLEGTRKQGMYSALPPDAAERQKLREQIIMRIVKETQAAETKAPAPERRVK